MNVLLLRNAPLILSVASNAPQAALNATDLSGLAAACDVVLALAPGAFPRQGVDQATAVRVAGMLKHALTR
jgi:hypothetical protein